MLFKFQMMGAPEFPNQGQISKWKGKNLSSITPCFSLLISTCSLASNPQLRGLSFKITLKQTLLTAESFKGTNKDCFYLLCTCSQENIYCSHFIQKYPHIAKMICFYKLSSLMWEQSVSRRWKKQENCFHNIRNPWLKQQENSRH